MIIFVPVIVLIRFKVCDINVIRNFFGLNLFGTSIVERSFNICTTLVRMRALVLLYMISKVNKRINKKLPSIDIPRTYLFESFLFYNERIITLQYTKLYFSCTYSSSSSRSKCPWIRVTFALCFLVSISFTE